MTQYGVAYGHAVEESDSLEHARARAHVVAASGTTCDVVQLEGAGPVYASDGEQIAPTHAPRRTLDTYTPRHLAEGTRRWVVRRASDGREWAMERPAEDDHEGE